MAHRILRSQRRMMGVITRCLDGSRRVMITLLASRWMTLSGCQGRRSLPMTRVTVIIVVIMIMDVEAGCRFKHGIADVLRYGLAGTVITAVTDPAS
jgi:hypothetical protein